MELPTVLTLGGVSYDILRIRTAEDGCIRGDTLMERALGFGAMLGEEDGQRLLAHQGEIPAALRGKVRFIFPMWICPEYPRQRAEIRWSFTDWDAMHKKSWRHDWVWLDAAFCGTESVLRRR